MVGLAFFFNALFFATDKGVWWAYRKCRTPVWHLEYERMAFGIRPNGIWCTVIRCRIGHGQWRLFGATGRMGEMPVLTGFAPCAVICRPLRGSLAADALFFK